LRHEIDKAWIPSESSRHLEEMDWPNIPTARGFNSRAGLPTYVDEMRGLGNAVVPQVSEWIARRIVAVNANTTKEKE
jgi:hypothetical protein